ncbi:hypothetical protein SAMN04487948_10867 [Halogranum amylolyticum]|uniref:Uncharacterized protein n=2 Tax=Halogranum amylolyticum TaxID=660520 RepID=A0A1H8TST2_9EURY|nr:hypothetical protein SAMN04487948_10867 [Halogranum amylolyticum]
MTESNDRETETVYKCSNGRYYGDTDVWTRLESGAWKPFCWDTESGEEWVETQQEETLLLVPIPHSSLPEEVETERVSAGISVTLSRSTHPDER